MKVLHLTFKTAKGLPEICAARLPTDGPIIIMRGESYYYRPIEGFDPDEFNRAHGVTKAQAQAMFWGILCGWHTPGANPASYDENGKSID